MSDPVKTACFCPNTPHESDEFHLADELPMEAGLAAAVAQFSSTESNAVAQVVGAMLRNGAIAKWNLVDEDGDPLPINPANVGSRVTWLKGGVELTGAALAKYVNAKGGAPLGLSNSARKNGKLSRTGRKAASTSAETPSSPESPEPSA